MIIRGIGSARKPVEQVAVVGLFDHGFEDRADGVRSGLVRQRRCVQRAGVIAGLPGSLGEFFQEAARVIVWVSDDLAAEEAVFGREVALDVDETGDFGGLLISEQQCR
jgi:hypothetical protein